MDEEKWVLLTTDEAACFDGEFQDKDPILFCWPPRKGSFSQECEPGSLLLILSFWILTMHHESGGRKSPMCSFRSGFGSNVCGLVCLCPSLPACVLSGVICLHVDDMLEVGDDVFE